MAIQKPTAVKKPDAGYAQAQIITRKTVQLLPNVCTVLAHIGPEPKNVENINMNKNYFLFKQGQESPGCKQESFMSKIIPMLES